MPASMDSSGARALPDVSMDSGSAQEYDVFTSTLGASSDSAAAVGWLGDAGTSAASPIWAGLIAIADQGRALAGGSPMTGYTQTLPALYSLPASDFHDIVYGSNGYSAAPGYDLATGRGTPIANLLVPALAGYGLASQMSIKTEPPSTVTANTGFGLTVQVEDSAGNLASGSYVTVALGSDPTDITLGGTLTAPVVNGLATFSNLTISQPDSGYTLTVTDNSFAGSMTTTAIDVTPPAITQSPATLTFTSLNFTYNGTAQFATVSTSPTGLSGVTISYAQNGVAVANPTRAGDYTVTATLNNANYVATPIMGTLVINQATPTLSWARPSNITVGTRLTSAQLDATASFNGTSVQGGLSYTPSFGTPLPLGNSQTLSVLFTPTDTTDFTTVTASVTINVVPPPPPPPPRVTIMGEQPVFRRKLNKHGKPVGAAILTGFTLDFNMPLATAAASNPANYQLDVVTTKKVKNKTVRVLKPIKNFTVVYTPATDSVTLKLAATQTFPLGGELMVSPGVAGGSGDVLSGTTAFKITAGGKKITP